MKFGEKVKKQRVRRKLTLDELARELGISRRTLCYYEQGKTYPRNRNIYQELADFFELDINYFLTEDEGPLAEAAYKPDNRRLLQIVAAVLEQATALLDAGELSQEDMEEWAQNNLFSRRLKERKYARPIREAIRYIDANCTQQLSLEQVAEQVKLSASYLCTLFKKETGQSFSGYLISCRIREAKRLLREDDLGIAQICLAVGYTDIRHFSRIFTKAEGIKLSDYRALYG